jgi:hypothetical protein
MAIRLQSVLAGAAKRGSERLKTLEEKADTLITTEASRVAKEISDKRKQRIKDKLDYGKAARNLKSTYNLSDAQVETVLAGGLENAAAFTTAIKAGEARAYALDKTKPFNANTYAQSLFSTTQDGTVTGRSIAEQEEAYAAGLSAPLTTSANESTQAIMAQLRASGARSGDEYVSGSLAAQTRAMGGEIPTEFTGAELGTTGMTVRGLGQMTPEELIALEQAQAKTDLTTAQVGSETALTGVREAQAQSIFADTDLAREKLETARITNEGLSERLGLEADKLREDVNQVIANIGLTEVRTATEGLSADKLETEIGLLDKYGAKEKQAALDLIEAQIYEKGNAADLEEYQAMQLRIQDDLLAKINNPDTDPSELPQLQQQLDDSKKRVSDASIALADTTSAADYFSKSSEDQIFNRMIQRNAQGLDIGGEMGPFGAEIALSLGTGKMPQYFTAVSNSIDEFANRFSDSKRGRRAYAAFASSFDKQLRSYANSQGFAEAEFTNHGVKTETELEALEKTLGRLYCLSQASYRS